MAHRWALLSNSTAWNSKTIPLRAVVANPKSYVYLDDRRWFPNSCDNPNGCAQSFHQPSQEVYNQCPEYNHYYWGLEAGGSIPCPYRDMAMAAVGESAATVANRYASRDVIYLSAEYDVLPQNRDHCSALWQGRNRNERARNYYASLKEYFGREIHEFHFVPFSGHDHALMFQSHVGRRAILGTRIDETDQVQQQDEIRIKKNLRQGVSRYIYPIDFANDESDDDDHAIGGWGDASAGLYLPAARSSPGVASSEHFQLPPTIQSAASSRRERKRRRRPKHNKEQQTQEEPQNDTISSQKGKHNKNTFPSSI